MGGVAKTVGNVLQGVGKSFSGSPAARAVENVTASAAAEKPRASRMDEEQGARMRGARRRGRSLLSDARLSAESGVETLGSGQQL
jgi:hypothetical protein